MIKKLFISTFLCFLVFFSGQNLKVSEIKKIFSQPSFSEWSMPIPQEKSIPLRWYPRNSSLKKEGIQSFVGYYQNTLVASLSIGKNSVSGSYTYNGSSFNISSKGNNIIFTKNEENEACSAEDPFHSHTENTELSVLEQGNSISKIANTNVLRVYRLAVPITYNVFSSWFFNNDIDKAKTFWADTEIFLNEIYTRDLGVRFEVINNEKLISKSTGEEFFDSSKNASYIINHSTQLINDLIGENNYDVGIVISHTSSNGIRGLAYIYGVYENYKGAALARPTKNVIAHEIGHLFGGRHTFSSPSFDYASEKTEHFRGQSVMSYGSPRDFFSLSSIHRIRERLASVPYYTDSQRTQVVGDKSFPNIPLGIPFNSAPPQIDANQIKNHYTIPENTFFQFYIPATDPDSSEFLYAAHQRDVRLGDEESIAQYTAYKPTTTNPVSFKREYSEQTGNEVANSWIPTQKTGTFTFWLGVSDAQPQLSSDYITQYDLAETKVTVKEGLPFVLTNTMKNKYKGGEKLTLTWQVDNDIFKNTKVRILLSDDFGKTYKYILANNIDNNGSYEVTLPNINIGNINFGNTAISIPAGIIKIEVIDGLAFALTNYNPKNGGGFIIEKNETLPASLSFTSVPKDITLSCEDTIPAVTMPTVTGGCNPKITYKEEKTNGGCSSKHIIKRVFTVTDDCNQSLTHTQLIKVVDNTAPVFTRSLPQNITIEEGDAVPAQITLTASDNCGTATVTSSKSEEKTNGKVSKIIYKWTAKDSCGNETIHTQIITIKPKTVQPLQFLANTLPANIHLACGSSIPNAVNPSVQGGCSPVSISHSDRRTNGQCSNNFTIERTYTAKDNCGNSISHVQIIKVEDTTAPTFVESLPQNITIEEDDAVPAQITLTASDNCGTATVTSSKSEEKTNGKVSKITYKWTAKDSCGNETTHTQIITIKLKNTSKKEEIKPELLYPNPVADVFYLQGFYHIQEVRVFDASGRLIKIFPEQKNYNISELKTGVYVIFVKGENYTRKLKLIKK